MTHPHCARDPALPGRTCICPHAIATPPRFPVPTACTGPARSAAGLAAPAVSRQRSVVHQPGCRGGLDRRSADRATGRSGPHVANVAVRVGARRAAQYGGRHRRAAIVGVAAGRPAGGPGRIAGAPPSTAIGGRGGSQCAARRAHVDARQPDRRGADLALERVRCIGGPGGDLHANGLRCGLAAGTGPARASYRHAHAGRRRLRGGDRRRVWCSAGRRVLRIRDRDRCLYAIGAGAGGGSRAGRRVHGQRLGCHAIRTAGGGGLPIAAARLRDLYRLGPGLCGDRHCGDAAGCRHRAWRRADQSTALGPAGDRWAVADSPGRVFAAGAVLRPRRLASGSDQHHHAAVSADLAGIEVPGLGHLAGIRVPRRPVLRRCSWARWWAPCLRWAPIC